MTTEEITALIVANVLTGGRRTTAVKQRELFNAMNTSLLNRESHLNIVGGYAGTEDILTEGRMPYFSTTGLLNGYLKQDGDAIILDDNKYISGSTQLAALSFGEVGSEQVTLGVNIIDPEVGDVISRFIADTSLGRIISSQNDNESIWNVTFSGISGSVYDSELGRLSSFVQSASSFVFSTFTAATNYVMIETIDNSVGDSSSSTGYASLPVFIGTQSNAVSQGVINSIAIGGQGHNVTESDSVYIPQTFLQPDKTLFGYNGLSVLKMGGSAGKYISLGLINDDVKVPGVAGEIIMIDNADGDFNWNAEFAGDKFPVYIATGGGVIKQGIIGSVALGCESVDMITSHAAYVDRIIHSSGIGTFPAIPQSVISWQDVTDDRSIIIPDDDGTILLTDASTGASVTPNGTVGIRIGGSTVWVLTSATQN